MTDLTRYDHLFKFVLIGDSAVGKTAILTQYVDHQFTDEFLTTIGVDFRVKMVERNQQKFKIQIVCFISFSYLKNISSKEKNINFISYDLFVFILFNNCC